MNFSSESKRNPRSEAKYSCDLERNPLSEANLTDPTKRTQLIALNYVILGFFVPPPPLRTVVLDELFVISRTVLGVYFPNKTIFISAQVNENMPRTFGDGVIHSSHCDALVQGNLEMPDSRRKGEMGEIEAKIGKLIADELVVDGATLQMGMSI